MKIPKKLWRYVLKRVLIDAWLQPEKAKERYGIKEVSNKTNHKTGDDITIVVDDKIWRK